MKPTRIVPLIVVALISACSTTDEQKPATTLSAPSATSAPTAAAAPATGAIANTPLTGTTQSPSNAAAATTAVGKNSVYFGFDEYSINSQYINAIEDHAKYLRVNPSFKARIEGNSDERGSREYNLALGQRRAEAVMKVLNMHGVPADRVEVISFGEEKPARTGHDDASWAENRRSDLLLKSGN
ncbi:MAG: peptidoglycan-associated lipoprotein Pal [Burkholderiales bacterium]